MLKVPNFTVDIIVRARGGKDHHSGDQDNRVFRSIIVGNLN